MKRRINAANPLDKQGQVKLVSKQARGRSGTFGEHSVWRIPKQSLERSNYSAAAGVASASSSGGGTRFGVSFSSAIRASFSRAS